jgi:hypothetical protein
MKRLRPAIVIARVGVAVIYEAWNDERSPTVFTNVIKPWSDLTREFRAEGFYERFPAKGQVERVRRIHTRLSQNLKQ